MRPIVFAIALKFICWFFVIVALYQQSEIKELALNVSGIMCLVGSFICASIDSIRAKENETK
jgi:hypothetical protein